MSKVPKAIEFKAGTLTALTAIVRDLDVAHLGEVLHGLLGDMDDYFAGELAVIDVGQLEAIPQQVDWAALATLLGGYGLQAVAIRNAPDELLAGARAAGMAVLARSSARAAPPPTPPVEDIAPVEAMPSATTNATATVTTKVVDRPVRSGQQVYAPGGDLILLNGVNPGAEVIADGNIHCYGPLRGRAVAGAQGNTAARIFCSNFGPELISIAGVYRTFEGGIEAKLANKPMQAQLRLENTAPRHVEADAGVDAGVDADAIVKHMLIIEPIQLD